MTSRVLITIGLLFTTTPAIAISYTSNGSGAWNTPSTWAPSGIPGGGDSATIQGGHTVTLDSARSVDNVTVNGTLNLFTFTLAAVNAPGITGTISGSGGALTISGTGGWSTGVLSAASLNVLSGASLTISGSTKTMQSSAQLVVGGTVNWTGGQILNNTTSLIHIQSGGVFDAQSNDSIANNSGAGSITNAGTFQKTGGGGTTTIAGGVPITTSGRIEASSGNIDAQSHTLNGATIGDGFSITSGTTTIASNSSVELGATMTMTGGTLAGSADLAVHGTLQWNGGTMSGAGASVTIPAGKILTIDTAATKTMQNSFQLHVAGTLNWLDGQILLNTFSVLDIQSGGVFDAQGNDQIANNSGAGSITSNGTFKKTGGASIQIVSGVPFHNSGRIEELSGTINAQTLNLNAGSVIAGLTVSSGTTSILGASSVEAGKTLTVSGGTLGGSSTLTVNGTLNFTGGTMNSGATVDVVAGANLNLDSGSTKTLSNGFDLNVFGTATWTGGQILLNTTSRLDVQTGGTLDIKTDNNVTSNSGAGSISNSGTILKSAGAGATIVTSNVPVASNGTIDIQSGTFSAANLTLDTGTLILGNGFTVNSGTTSVTGTSTVDAAATITLATGGVLGGTFPLTVDGTLEWTGGTMNGATAGANITSGATLNLTGGATKTLSNGFDLNIAGLATWTGGTILLNTGSLLTIQGSGIFDAQGTNSISNNSGAGSIANDGIFRKSTGGGVTTIAAGVPFAHNNRMEITSGTTNIQALTLNAGSVIAGIGFTLASGTTTIAGASSVESGAMMTFSGGTLAGTANLTIDGTLLWTGGAMSGAGGSVTVPASRTMTISGAVTMQNSFALNLAGTATWTSGTILLNTSSLLNIQAGGVFDAQSDNQIANNSGSGSIANNGTFKKTGGAGTTTITAGVPFSNHARIEIGSGTSDFQALTLNSGSVLAGTGFKIINGVTTLAGPSSVETGSSITLAGATLNGTSSLTINGTLEWTGGTMSGNASVIVPAAKVINISGAGTKTLSNGFDLLNAGTIHWTGGNILDNTGALIDNQAGGLFLIETDNQIANNSGNGTITNSGTLRKLTATGTTTIGGGVPFTNSGTIDVQLGKLQLTNPTFAGTTVLNFGISGATPLTGYGVLGITGAVAFNGTIDVDVPGPYSPMGGDQFVVITYGSHSGTLAESLAFEASRTFTTTYNPTNLTLTASCSPPSPNVSASSTSFCTGDSVTLTSSPTGGTAPYTYQWYEGANLLGSETAANLVVTVGGSYSVIVSDSVACDAQSPSVTITENPVPAVSISGPASVCPNVSFSLDAGAGFTGYAWSTGQTSQVITVSQVVSTTYNVTVTNASGCQATDSHVVSITANPDATISAPASVPPNATGNIASAPLQGSASYAWTIINGTITGGQGTNSITFDAPGGGAINLQLTVMISGCTATGTASVLTEETDIAIGKTAAATVQAGASLVYTIDVSNHGSFPAIGVTVVDSLPEGTTLAGIDPGPWDCTASGSDVTCVGDLAPEASSAITLTVTAPQQPGTITNSALVISDSDPNSENDVASATTTVTTPIDCTDAPPSLLTPPDNATNLLSPVTFGWSEVSGALSYEVWLISGGTPSLLASTTATTLAAGVPSGAYRWFVIAIMADGCNPLVSADRGFTVETSDDSCASRSVAFPIAPSDNSIVNTSSVTFRWNPALNADGYRVWAAIDGAAPAVLGTTVKTSLIAHIVKGEVLWWVEALYDGCASTESQRFHFTIPPKQNCGNARPELIGPATGANVTDGSVTFVWHGVVDAVGYEVYLAAGSGTPVLIGNTNAATTSLTHLVPPGDLEWTVLANFDRCPSRESQKSSFTFTPPADCIDYRRPILVSPLDDVITTSPTLFSWNAVAGATHFELYIVSETNAPVLVATTTATSLSGVQLASGNVRWFVRAYFGEPCAPLHSEERELAVVALPAACGELEAPVIAAPGQISSGVPFLVQWTPSIGATRYELEIAANGDFAGAELITTSATQQELARTNNGASPLSLFARVRAIDARCTPDPAISPDGPVSAIFILPTGGANGTAPAGNGGTISFTIPLDDQFAGQSFTAEPGVPWLSVSPSSGVVSANGTLLTAVADTTNLPIGASLGSVTVTFNTLDSGSVQTQGTTLSIPTISISLVTPVTPTLNTTPPPDALIIPAVAHANGINTTFQSDVRVSNTSPKLLKYRLTFTPSGSTGITSGRQTTFSVEPGHTIALDDILATWFGTGESSAIGMLEIRPLTETTTSTSSVPLTGLPNLVTFASSRTFNVTPNGTFGQYIPAIPFANFLGRSLDLSKPALLSLQQLAQSDRYRTNLGLVEASGEPVSLLVRVFGGLGEQLTAFPVNLAGGEHTQLNAFLAQQGINSLSDGRVEIEVLSAGGKVTAYASVLDNDTNDSLLVTPVTIHDTGASHWVIAGVADLNNGFANWQTDMRVFNAGTEDVDATLSFYSQNGGEPRTASINVPAGRVRQFDKSLASLFNVTNDGGAIHIDTGSAARLIITARTYNETSSGTFGQFISAVTPLEAAGLESRPLQLLQVEESSRYRSNIGLAEVTGNPVKLEISIVPPDAKLTAITELTLAPNEFRQIGSLLKAVGLQDTFNARVSIRVTEGSGRVTAYVSVIDAITNDPTYLPAQ